MFVSYWNTNIYLIALFDQKRQNPFFLYFDKCGRWHADSFLIEGQKNMFLSCELWVMSREVWDHSITCFLCSSISQKTKLQSWWSCWTRFSICPRWSINIGSQWDPEICDWARAEPSLLELCRAWANWTKLNELFAFAHRKHLLFFKMRYGQDDLGWGYIKNTTVQSKWSGWREGNWQIFRSPVFWKNVVLS